MLPKIKRLLNNNKKEVRIGLIILIIIIVLLVLYKSLFYSNAEKAIYGDRLRDIKKNELTKKQRVELHDKVSTIEGISNVKIEVKGRLIKFFITYNEGLTPEDIQSKCNESLTHISDKVKNYYDITFYSIQVKEGKTTYPVIGYKQKGNETISFDVF